MTPLFSNPLPLILAAVIGILVGLLISLIFRSDNKAAPEENPLPKKFVDKGFAEAARVYYSPAEKKAITMMDGDFYAEYSMLTPEQKGRVLRILSAWEEWSGGIPAAAPVVKPQAQPAAPSVSAPVPTAPAQVLPPVKPTAAEPGKPAAAGKPATPVVKQQTIIEQINDVLGEMLLKFPEEKRNVQLMDDGHQGVLVWVGLEKFNSVDEVPYPEVKELIRGAVAKWEATVAKVEEPKQK